MRRIAAGLSPFLLVRHRASVIEVLILLRIIDEGMAVPATYYQADVGHQFVRLTNRPLLGTPTLRTVGDPDAIVRLEIVIALLFFVGEGMIGRVCRECVDSIPIPPGWGNR
jgi:hypothetical protein